MQSFFPFIVNNNDDGSRNMKSNTDFCRQKCACADKLEYSFRASDNSLLEVLVRRADIQDRIDFSLKMGYSPYEILWNNMMGNNSDCHAVFVDARDTAFQSASHSISKIDKEHLLLYCPWEKIYSKSIIGKYLNLMNGQYITYVIAIGQLPKMLPQLRQLK